VAFTPDLVSTVRTGVSVQVGASPAVGQTSLTRIPTAPAHEVALEVDTERFLGLFRRTLNLE
jgi:inosine-uridine nucleoside N-ribohydrolase